MPLDDARSLRVFKVGSRCSLLLPLWFSSRTLLTGCPILCRRCDIGCTPSRALHRDISLIDKPFLATPISPLSPCVAGLPWPGGQGSSHHNPLLRNASPRLVRLRYDACLRLSTKEIASG